MQKYLFSKFRIIAFALTVAATLSGCGGGSSEETAANTAQDQASSAVATTNTDPGKGWFYGYITTTDDRGAPSAAVPRANFTVNLYPISASQPTSGSGAAVASATSNAAGFYELPANAGSYWLCTSFFRCTSVSLAADEKQRRDYAFGAGPGW